MLTFPVIDKWNKDPEFQNLPYDVKRQKVLAYFDAYHADAEFRALPEGRQEEIKGRIVVAHLGEAPAPPATLEPNSNPEFSMGRLGSQIVRHGLQGAADVVRGLSGLEKRVWEPSESGGQLSEAGYIAQMRNRADQATRNDPYRARRDQLVEGIKPIEEYAPQPLEGTPQGFGGLVEQAAGGMARFAPSMAISTVSAPAGLATTFTQIYGMKREEYLQQGVDEDRADAAAMVSAIGQTPIEFAGNLLQIGALKNIAKAVKGPAWGRLAAFGEGLLKGIVGEGGEEYLQAYPEEMADIYAANPDIPPEHLVGEIAKRIVSREFQKQAGHQAVVGAVGGGMLAGAGGLVAEGTNLSLFRYKTEEQKRIDSAKTKDILKTLGINDQAPNAPDIETVPPGSLDTRQDGTIMPPASPPEGPVFANGSESTLTPPNIETVGSAPSETVGLSGFTPGFDLLSGNRDIEPPQAPAGQVDWNPVDQTQQAAEMMRHAGMQPPDSSTALPAPEAPPGLPAGQGFEMVGQPYGPQLETPGSAFALPPGQGDYVGQNQRGMDFELQGEPYTPQEAPAEEVEAPDTELDQAAQETATSPANDIPEPTEAQIKAGNYKKGHINFHGLDISIENPKGSTRKGTDADGKPWETEMVHHYGYIRRTEGKDGDQVDIFMGSDQDSDRVFVVDQVDPGTGKFDEHKVMLGFSSREAAIQGYLDNYADDWQGLGAITEVPVEKFKQWLGSSKRKMRPVGIKTPKARNGAVDLPARKKFFQDLKEKGVAVGPGGVSYSIQHSDAVGYYIRTEENGNRDEFGNAEKGSGWSLMEARRQAADYAFGGNAEGSKPRPATAPRLVKDLSGIPIKEIDAVLDDVFGPVEKPKPKTGQLAKEVGIEAVAGVKQAVKGLSKLFTPKNALGMGAVFDEDTYKEAKPHFESALKHAVKTGQTLKDLAKHLHNLFGDQIRPYLERFLKERAQGQTASNDVAKPEKATSLLKKELRGTKKRLLNIEKRLQAVESEKTAAGNKYLSDSPKRKQKTPTANRPASDTSGKKPTIDDTGQGTQTAANKKTRKIAPAKKRILFSTKKGTAGAVTLDDVQAVFKGQDVGIRADGNGFWVKLKNGKTLTIQNVEHIEVDTVQFKAAYGDVDPEAISGAYSSTGTISISEPFGDKWTLAHEMVHAIEDMGMLNKLDVNVLRNHIRKIADKGKFKPTNPDDIGGIEDRANFIQDTMAARAQEKGPLGRVLQKLEDFFTRFANLFRRTAGGIVSDIESGKIFERPADAVENDTEAYKLADILTKDMPENWKVKESNDLGKRERFTRPPAWIAKKFPAFRLLFERQRSREKERTKQMAKTLEEIKSFLELEGEDLDMLRELIWKLEGEKIPAVKGISKFKRTEDGRFDLNPKHYATLSKALKQIDGLTEATVDAYINIRKSLDRDMTAVFNMLNQMDDIDPGIIDEYRRQMGSIQNYFPHMRYGSHYIQAVEGREVVYREHFNAPLGVNLKKWSKFKEIEAKYPGAELSIGKVEKIPEDVFTIPIPTEAIEAVMIAAVKRVPDPKMQQAFKEILPQATADALRSRGWGSHMINRKGIPGHETDDIKRVLFDYKAGLYGWLTKIETSRDMSETISKIDATGKPRLWAAMRKYIHDMMANADWADQVINSMRAIFFAKYLGGNIKTAALNLTQNIIAGWPRLGMEVGKSAGMVMKASSNAIVASMTKNKRLPEDEQRLLHELLEEGVTDSNFLTEVRGQIGSNVFSASNKVMRVLGWPMGFAEGLNRSTLALAAYRAAVSGKIQRTETLAELGLAKGEKASYEVAKRFAETVVNDAHFVYGKSNRPEALRGDVGKWGSLAYTFRTFSHNLINLWSWMYKQGGPGRKALLKSIGAMAVIGGLSSIPLYKTFMHILREATGDDWEEKLIDSWFPDQAHLMRDMIVYGVPAGMGFTLGGSVGMELPVFDKMKLHKSLTGQLGSNIGEIIGVPWAVIEDLEAAANSYRSGQKLRALEYLLPTAASNPLKAIRMHTTGQTSISGRPISDPGSNAPRKITVKEAIGKAMGLQPVSSTKSWDLYKTIQAFAEFKQAKQRSFANRIANAWRVGDMKKVREIAGEIEAWNKEQLKRGRYRYLITNDDIIRALQSRSRSGQLPKYLWHDTGKMMRQRGVVGFK